MNVTLKQSRKTLKALLIALFGWPLYGAAYFIPRVSNKYVFGVYASSFSGNTKALYLDKKFAPDCVKVLLYKKKSIQMVLDAMPDSAQHLYFSIYSVKGIYHALTAKYYVYSNYLTDISYWLSNGAATFNVWHGTPLKAIERDVRVGRYAGKNKWGMVLKFIFPYFYVRPDKLLVCSDYEKKCFQSAFNIESNSTYVCAFPPRLNAVEEIITNKRKDIVLYCPTWRDDGGFVFQDVVDIEKLNSLMSDRGLCFVLKPHPSDLNCHLTKKYSHVRLESRLTDIYNLLPRSTLLVTDYSSIMFDAVYCGISTLLFCSDLSRYLKQNRNLYISIEDIGLPVIRDGNAFLVELENNESLQFPVPDNDLFNVYKNKDICI